MYTWQLRCACHGAASHIDSICSYRPYVEANCPATLLKVFPAASGSLVCWEVVR